jgi:hypothetical protein
VAFLKQVLAMWLSAVANGLLFCSIAEEHIGTKARKYWYLAHDAFTACGLLKGEGVVMSTLGLRIIVHG